MASNYQEDPMNPGGEDEWVDPGPMIIYQNSFLPVPMPGDTGNMLLPILPTLILKMFYRRETVYRTRKSWKIDVRPVSTDCRTLQIHYTCKKCAFVLCDLNRVRINEETNDLDPIWYIGNNDTHSGRSTTLARLKRHERRGCHSIFPRQHRQSCQTEGRNSGQPPEENAAQPMGENPTTSSNMDGGPSTSHLPDSSAGQEPHPDDGDLVSVLDDFLTTHGGAYLESEEDWESNLLQYVDAGMGNHFF